MPRIKIEAPETPATLEEPETLKKTEAPETSATLEEIKETEKTKAPETSATLEEPETLKKLEKTTKAEAQALMKAIAKLSLQADALQNTFAEQIHALKNTHQKELLRLNNTIKQKTKTLSAYANANKKELFDDKRSYTLLYGTMGWRKSKSLKTKKTTLSLLHQHGLDEYIRVKESPDKDRMRKLSSVQLEQVGAQIVEKDDFFVEPDLAKLELS